jgi:hypothetical protein
MPPGVTFAHVPLSPARVRSHRQVFSFTAIPASGEPRTASVAQCVPASKPAPKLAALDKLFWVLARRFWSDWKSSLPGGHSGNDGQLASHRLSPLLEHAL